MMFLVGLMGLMAVGATAFFGFGAPVLESDHAAGADRTTHNAGYQTARDPVPPLPPAANVNRIPTDDGVSVSMNTNENDLLSGQDTLIFNDKNAATPPEDSPPSRPFAEQLQQGHVSQISGFVVGEDSLVVTYDDTAGAEPGITLQPDEDTPSTQHVLINGVRVTTVLQAGGLSLDDIVLISKSTLDSLLAPSEQAA